MKKDYYKEVIVEIKKLIKTDHEKAYKKLEVELNMPYIPEKYEAQFLLLLEDLRSEMLGNAPINNELSKDEVLDILKQNDSFKVPMALSKLRDLNIKPMLKELEQIIKNPKTPTIIKTVIYEYCVEQDINYEFDWNNTKVNPSKIGSTINLKIYKEALEFIETAIAKNPSLKELAFKNLELYILNSFPEVIESKIELGPAIVQIAHELIGLPFDNSIDAKEINKIKEKLQNKL